MIDFTQITSVLTITVCCYLLGLACKVSIAVKDELIPVIMGISGAILGVVAWITVPAFPAEDWLNAVAVGIVSGLAATGTNQIYKQLTKEG